MLFVYIKITKEEKCSSLLCSVLDSWDSLVMAIGSNNTTLQLDDVAATLLLKETRWKIMERLTPEAFLVRG